MGGKANVVRKVKTDKEVCRNRQEKPNERQMERLGILKVGTGESKEWENVDY